MQAKLSLKKAKISEEIKKGWDGVVQFWRKIKRFESQFKWNTKVFQKNEHFSDFSKYFVFLIHFSFLKKYNIGTLNEFDLAFRKAAFHAPYKAYVALQQKQQAAAVTTVGNKREVPKVFSVELKKVRRRTD